MDKNVTKTPETHSEELVDSLKLICDIIIGPELRLIKDYVGEINESLSLDHSNLEQKVEGALATIREDAMAISADLRKTKLEVESDGKEQHEKINGIENQVQRFGNDLSNKINASENTLATNITKLREHMKINAFNLTQDHAQRFTALEERVAQCEDVNSGLKEENIRLTNRLTNAAQSLVTGANKVAPAPTLSRNQVEDLLTEMDEGQAEPVAEDARSGPDHRVSKDSTVNNTESGDDHSSKVEMVDIDAVLHEI